ncbi:hypothetical protein Pelo_5960 [Pelomyxa schiedti]|nr:hypothetical protein Pelo_5960 [Pelomyxa schiedti]
MLDAPDCCDPGLQQEFRILVDDAVTACAYTSFADILRPLLSFSQVICNAAPLDTGETGEECMRELLVKFAAQPNFELMSVPLCIPCASDILTREKMDLAFDLMCSLQPNYWPDDPEVQACSCLGIYNESLGNTSVVPIPSDCLIPLTGAKTPLAGTTAYVPSHCDSNIGTMNSVLLCCSRLLDDMLGMMDMQTGVSGMRSSMCISQKWHLRMRLGHFNYAKAQQRASKEAIIQMAFDEVAHRIPAIDRDEFLQNVTLTQSDQTTDSSNITLMDVTYEPMSELGLNASTMDFETGDVLLEMTDYLLADDGNITIETVDMVLEGGESSELSVSDSAVVVPLISAFLVVGAVALLL